MRLCITDGRQIGALEIESSSKIVNEDISFERERWWSELLYLSRLIWTSWCMRLFCESNDFKVIYSESYRVLHAREHKKVVDGTIND